MTRSRRDTSRHGLSDADMQIAQRNLYKRFATMSGSAGSRPSNVGHAAERAGLAVVGPIHVEDDDDDVQLLSPRSSAQVQAKSDQRASRQRSRSSAGRRNAESRSMPEADLLTLRLGSAEVFDAHAVEPAVSLQRPPASTRSADTSFLRHRHDRGGKLTIDLTRVSSPSPNDTDCILVNEFVQKKRKSTLPAGPTPPEPAKEVKLTCAICMDFMKEETSTICGHLFCRKCILGAITVQKKCPTCRQKLTVSATHRIYIGASVRG